MDGEATVRRARALVGIRFRLQGRSRASGLDCVGVVACALGIETVRSDYRLRGGSLSELRGELRAAGLEPAPAAAAGDVLVARPAAEQLHLGIWTGSGTVHADARLGRVAERPGRPPWPVLERWRRRAQWQP